MFKDQKKKKYIQYLVHVIDHDQNKRIVDVFIIYLN